MDSRKQKNVSSGSKSRGRGVRSQVAPPPSHQGYYPQLPTPHAYYPQPPTPHGYYPQPSTPHAYYPPPMQPRDYVIDQTTELEFDPMLNYRDEVVPETQELPNDDEVQEVQDVPTNKVKKRADKIPWTQEEEEALAKAWIHISTCRVVGNEQHRDKFWERILEHFGSLMGGTTRTHHSLNTKWNTMNTNMGVFNGLYHQSARLRESGCNDMDVMKNAMTDYSTKTRRPFTHQAAWLVVKDEAKWVEQKCVTGTSSTHSDKRRKSSEGGNYETDSNDPNNVIPDLNEDSTPTRSRKGKKKVDEMSSRADSVVETVNSYAEAKEKMMTDLTEKTQQLLDIQIEQAKDKKERQDFKYYMEPHDHIEDPIMLEWVKNKKRLLAAKYGWPCNF